MLILCLQDLLNLRNAKSKYKFALFRIDSVVRSGKFVLKLLSKLPSRLADSIADQS